MEDKDEAVQRWVENPSTRAHARSFKNQAEQALLNLFAACRDTADPKVAFAYTRYEQLAAFGKVLSGEVKS